MRKTLIISLMAFVSMSTGCASVMHGRTQSIKFLSAPDKADVKVDGFNMCKTPCIAEISREKGHTVTMEVPGFLPFTAKIKQEVDGGCLLGNIFTGLIQGMIVDAGSGAMYNLVPDTIGHTFDARFKKGDWEETISSDVEVRYTYGSILRLQEGEWDHIIDGLNVLEKEEIKKIAKSKIIGCDTNKSGHVS